MELKVAQFCGLSGVWSLQSGVRLPLTCSQHLSPHCAAVLWPRRLFFCLHLHVLWWFNHKMDSVTSYHWNKRNGIKNFMYNACWIKKKVQIIKISSVTAFHKVYKVSPKSTTHKIEQFCKGVWGFLSALCCRTLLLQFAVCCNEKRSLLEIVVKNYLL